MAEEDVSSLLDNQKMKQWDRSLDSDDDGEIDHVISEFKSPRMPKSSMNFLKLKNRGVGLPW